MPTGVPSWPVVLRWADPTCWTAILAEKEVIICFDQNRWNLVAICSSCCGRTCCPSSNDKKAFVITDQAMLICAIDNNGRARNIWSLMLSGLKRGPISICRGPIW